MSLEPLIANDLDAFIRDNASADALWFFVHIPKTAGSSFRNEMASILSSEYNIHVDGDDRAVPHTTKLLDALARFRLANASTPYRFASGHVSVRQFSGILSGQDQVRFLTFLREPVTRVVSEFRYQRTPTHPDHKFFIEQYPTLEDYIHVEAEQNKMFNFLTPSESATPRECIDFLVNRFSLVGIVEMYPLSFKLATMLLGVDRAATLHERKTESSDQTRVHLTEALVSEITALNRKDVEIYAFFRRLLHPLRDKVWKLDADPV